MEGISLLQLNQYVRRVLALNFSDPLWVQAELAQVSVSRGHYYLDLVQQTENAAGPIAQARANLWASQLQQLRRMRGAAITELFRPGLELLLKVEPTLHERYGYSLKIVDINPDFTEGLLGKAKREVLQKLEAENLLDRNAKLYLPRVLQRIAVISSEQAAGYADFCRQLKENQWGYEFSNRLFRAAVQGDSAVEEMSKRLREIGRRAQEFDVICILRGGGSKLDLMAFDQEVLNREVAHCPVPVLSAIGHETDQSVLDLVAHTSVKTPTAAAVFLIDRMAQFEAELKIYSRQLKYTLSETLQHEKRVLNQCENRMEGKAQLAIREVESQLDLLDQKWINQARRQTREQLMHLAHLEGVVQILDPLSVLERGYALISCEGQLLSRAEQAESSKEVVINWLDGQKRASLLKTDPEKDV
ncbi:MAG: exodeoxyribonuclease VII large subunit [Bacteroidota bacterium]